MKPRDAEPAVAFMFSGQAPGIQNAYGRGALLSPSSHFVTAAHSDHDFLLVRASITGRAR